jgi:hypothetical protein
LFDHSFYKISQAHYIESFERCVKHFLDEAEKAAAGAQAKV